MVITDASQLLKPFYVEFMKQKLKMEYGDHRVLIGPIPYGEIFGEYYNTVTISQFLDYMENYSYHFNSNSDWFDKGTLQYPLYIFDSNIMLNTFGAWNNLPGKLVRLQLLMCS